MGDTDLGQTPNYLPSNPEENTMDLIASSSKTSFHITLSSEVTHTPDRDALQQEGPPIIAQPSANLNLQNIAPVATVEMTVYDLPNWLEADVPSLNHKQAS